jgi:hypothetical protein
VRLLEVGASASRVWFGVVKREGLGCCHPWRRSSCPDAVRMELLTACEVVAERDGEGWVGARVRKGCEVAVAAVGGLALSQPR